MKRTFDWRHWFSDTTRRAAGPRHGAWRRLWRDETGVTAVIVALALAALVGFTGLGVETGLWYAIKRYDQSATDVAAVSGTMEHAASKAYSDVCGLAKIGAEANGFSFETGWSCPAASPSSAAACSSLTSGQMCVDNPPLFGPHAGDDNYVEVILARQQNTFFSRPWLSEATIDTRAVAEVTQVQTCMIALGTPDYGQGTALEYKGGGNAGLYIPNCAFASASTDPDSIDLRGNFKICGNPGCTIPAGGVSTSGNYVIKGGAGIVLPSIVTGAPQVTDPYGTVTVTAPSGTCTPDPDVKSGTATLKAGTAYCALTISGGTVTIPAGLYYLVGTSGKKGTPGNLTISGGTVNGSGVTFVLTGPNVGTIQITGGTGSLTPPGINAGLLPPSANASAGLLIFQDPAAVTADGNPGTNTIAPGCSGSSLSLTGAIDTSKTVDDMQGNPTSCSNCTELIAAAFTLGGTPYLDTSTCASFGVKTDTVSGAIALTE
jgi:Putative Flp pilus-assembly TadE/G-like